MLILVVARVGRERGGAARAALFGTAAGIGFALQAAVTKVFVTEVGNGVSALLTTWSTYVLILSAIVGFVLQQSALKTGSLAPAMASSNASTLVFSTLFGIIVFGEALTRGGGRVAIATWAAVADSPGYAALVDIVAQTVGEDAADAIREPFCLSDPAEVGALVAASFADAEVHRHPGVARFDSIESMVHAEIRGWTLSDTIDNEQYERMLAAARADLAFVTDAAGRVEFAMPALVATGRC